MKYSVTQLLYSVTLSCICISASSVSTGYVLQLADCSDRISVSDDCSNIISLSIMLPMCDL